MKLLNCLKEEINKKRLISNLKTMGITGEEAKSELKDLIEYVHNLPEEITLYRLLSVDKKEDINTKELGSHYSISKKDLLDSHSYVSDYGENHYLVTVKANKKLIDIEETISNRILYPNEQEITLKNKGKGIEIVKIQKIKT